MKDKTYDNDSELKTIAQNGLLSIIEQGFSLIAGLKAIEAIESIVASGTVDIDGPMSVQVIETRDEIHSGTRRLCRPLARRTQGRRERRPRHLQPGRPGRRVVQRRREEPRRRRLHPVAFGHLLGGIAHAQRHPVARHRLTTSQLPGHPHGWPGVRKELP